MMLLSRKDSVPGIFVFATLHLRTCGEKAARTGHILCGMRTRRAALAARASGLDAPMATRATDAQHAGFEPRANAANKDVSSGPGRLLWDQEAAGSNPVAPTFQPAAEVLQSQALPANDQRCGGVVTDPAASADFRTLPTGARSAGATQPEMWLPIRGFPFYEVSNLGRIRQVGITRTRLQARTRRQEPVRFAAHICKPTLNAKGYRCVWLRSAANKSRRLRVGRLVLEAFVGAMPKPWQCNHIDGVKHNDRVDNLEWVTPLQNVRHAIRTGLFQRTRGRGVAC